MVKHFDGVCKPVVVLIRTPGCVISTSKMNRLIDYLRQNLMIDFQGDLSVAKVRELLAGDDSRDAKTLLTKLVAERNVEDMMLVLAVRKHNTGPLQDTLGPLGRGRGQRTPVSVVVVVVGFKVVLYGP